MCPINYVMRVTVYECGECGNDKPCMLCDINVSSTTDPVYCPYDGSMLARWSIQKDIEEDI